VHHRSTAVPVGPPRPSIITHPETCSSDCDLQLRCRIAQVDPCLGQFGTGDTGATTRPHDTASTTTRRQRGKTPVFRACHPEGVRGSLRRPCRGENMGWPGGVRCPWFSPLGWQVTRVPPYVRRPFPASKENLQISERDALPKRRPHAPIWVSEIIVARLVFGFVTRRIWFTRVSKEVKHSFFQTPWHCLPERSAPSRPTTRPQRPSPRGCHHC
jgi:hypothetical protein